ncbi:MAG: GNAT family N-acetyltransferase [Bacteroidales bacterium]|nr:GNAT family N-acetyltransferase [Bacteroidales bacterium]
MTIEEITCKADLDFGQMTELMHQLNPELKVTEEMVQQTIEAPDSHLFVMRDGARAIGCATLGVFNSPTGRKASIEDVVVLDEYRGQGLGKRLIEHLLSEAVKLAPIKVQLTSRPVREAANKLYQSMGFTRRDTNFYIINLL